MLIPARTGEAVAARGEPVAWASRVSTEVWLVAGFTLVGAILRLATISTQSFWLDEALAARELHLSFGAMWSSIAHGEPNPPLFFVIAWPWAKLFGTSEAGLRSLSALAGTAVIPIAYLCGRELVSRRAGLLAAAFTACSPFMIWYSQEAREYMLLTAFCAGSFLLFARSWRTASMRDLGWWTVLSALALLTHYFAAFIVAPEAVALLYRLRSRASVFAVVALLVVEGALIPHFLSHQSHPAGWIGAFPLSVRLGQVPAAFALGTIYQAPATSYSLIGAAAVIAVIIALLVIGAGDRELRGAGLAAAIAAFVLLAPLLLAALGHDYYVPRALIAAWVPLAVIVGAACAATRTRSLGAAVALAIIAVFIWSGIRIIQSPQYQRPDWRGVAAALGRSSSPRAIVAYDGGFAAVPLSLYLGARTVSTATPAPVAVREIDVVGSPFASTPQRLGSGVTLLSSRLTGGYLVRRFALARPVLLTPAAVAARAGDLLGPAPPGAAVLLQGAAA